MDPRNSPDDPSEVDTKTAVAQVDLDDNGLPSPTHSSSNSVKSVSTARWDREQHEAEELFHHRVEQLSKILWPPPTSLKHRVAGWLHPLKGFRSLIPAPQAPLIERLRGGDLSHITSIKIPWVSEAEGRDLILRVPRWDQHRIEREIAILDFVRQKSTIPVPLIVKTDLTSKNALEKPFVLQRRVPGSSLNTMWKDLNHLQQCKIARELGAIVRSLLSVESKITGLIRASREGTTLKGPFEIIPFEVEHQEEDEDTNESCLESNSQAGGSIQCTEYLGIVPVPNRPLENYRPCRQRW